MILQLWWFPIQLPAKQGVPNLTRPFAPAVESSDPSLEVLPLWHKGPFDRHHILFINLLAGWQGKCRSVVMSISGTFLGFVSASLARSRFLGMAVLGVEEWGGREKWEQGFDLPERSPCWHGQSDPLNGLNAINAALSCLERHEIAQSKCLGMLK